jgi:hypothetical protein
VLKTTPQTAPQFIPKLIDIMNLINNKNTMFKLEKMNTESYALVPQSTLINTVEESNPEEFDESADFYDDVYSATYERMQNEDYYFVRIYRPTYSEFRDYPDFFLQPVPYELKFKVDRNTINDFLVQKALAKGIPVPPRFAEVFSPSGFRFHRKVESDVVPVWQMSPEEKARRIRLAERDREFCDDLFERTRHRINCCLTRRGDDYCFTREIQLFPAFFAQYLPAEIYFKWDNDSLYDILAQKARVCGIAIPKWIDGSFPPNEEYGKDRYIFRDIPSDSSHNDIDLPEYVPTDDERENYPEFFHSYDFEYRGYRGMVNDRYDRCTEYNYAYGNKIPPRCLELFPPDSYNQRVSERIIYLETPKLIGKSGITEMPKLLEMPERIERPKLVEKPELSEKPKIAERLEIIEKPKLKE